MMNSISSATDPTLIAAVIEVLNQGEALLCELDEEAYTRKLPAAFNAAMGGHYRHCLDHFRSLIEAAYEGDLDYDHRERGTLIETDRFAALNATRALRESYEQLTADCLNRQISVTCKTSYEANGSQTSQSTIAREIMYVVAHAVHHYALIGIMGGLMGATLPAGFGVAPSTTKYQSEVAADVRRRKAEPLQAASSKDRLLASAATTAA